MISLEGGVARSMDYSEGDHDQDAEDCFAVPAGSFTEAVLCRGVRLSMDGKGAWRDNVFVERVGPVSN
ncbi:hypothetical protein [Burkholderia orbicola]|uniref:hypothetical protein n=1 Tax=Burkholderia orbicola TaxID=2978683 RepID=UPI002FDFE79C